LLSILSNKVYLVAPIKSNKRKSRLCCCCLPLLERLLSCCTRSYCTVPSRRYLPFTLLIYLCVHTSYRTQGMDSSSSAAPPEEEAPEAAAQGATAAGAAADDRRPLFFSGSLEEQGSSSPFSLTWIVVRIALTLALAAAWHYWTTGEFFFFFGRRKRRDRNENSVAAIASSEEEDDRRLSNSRLLYYEIDDASKAERAVGAGGTDGSVGDDVVGTKKVAERQRQHDNAAAGAETSAADVAASSAMQDSKSSSAETGEPGLVREAAEDAVDDRGDATEDVASSAPSTTTNAGKRGDQKKKKTKQKEPPPPPAPPFAMATNDHPGLEAFWDWCDVETSLFRIYLRGRYRFRTGRASKSAVEVVPPYNPSSRRGQVRIRLEVTNRTSRPLTAYWVDYKGREIDKGRFGPGRTWNQTTFVDHPWVFRSASEEDADRRVVLHYIPYRVIPTTEQVPTVDPDDPQTGLHRFAIMDWKRDGDVDDEEGYECQVDDPVLPYPARDSFGTAEKAASWTLMHCHRMEFLDWRTLIQYLSNIIQHPDEIKYRRIRIANPKFSRLWLSPARGLLLALGFVEHNTPEGAFAELGCASHPLSRARVQEVSQLVYRLEQWERHESSGNNRQQRPQQPLGADGFGRAGYGRVGSID